jgi:hypothetical protein
MTRPFFSFTLAQIRERAETASLDELRAAYGEVQLRGQRHRAKGHNTTAYEQTLALLRNRAAQITQTPKPKVRVPARRRHADAWTNAAQLYARA